jgi:hypothetical protein
MRRVTSIGLPAAILLLGAAPADARPQRPVLVSEAPHPHLVIVASQGAFLIRPQKPPNTAGPSVSVPLGANVHVDAAALRHFNSKDINNGKAR